MKKHVPSLIMLACALAGAHAALAENTMYSCTNADGSQSLTNVPVNGSCERMFDYTPPAAAAATQADAAPAPAPAAAPLAQSRAPASAPTADPRKPKAADGKATSPAAARAQLGNVLAGRRNAAIQETADAYARGEPSTAVNQAVNRRYLMTNRAEYIKANGPPR